MFTVLRVISVQGPLYERILLNANKIVPIKGDFTARIFVWSYGLLLVQDFMKNIGKPLGFSC